MALWRIVLRHKILVIQKTWRGYLTRRMTRQELDAARGVLCLLRLSWDPTPKAKIAVAGQLSLLGTGLPDWEPVPCPWCSLRREHVFAVRPSKEVLEMGKCNPRVRSLVSRYPLLGRGV